MASPQPVPPLGEEYHKRLLAMLPENPHLEALVLYASAIEAARGANERGSHDSDSLLVMEIAHNGSVLFDSINVYDPADVVAHREVFSGTGDPLRVKNRVLLIEDVSPGAITVLSAGFNLNPHVFYFHLGFDTRGSAMQALIDPLGEVRVPVTWYFPHHGPEDFLSIPLQCDLRPAAEDATSEALEIDRTYSRQFYRPISHVMKENQPAINRGFHRISVAFPQTQIKTTIILAFPTWKRRSTDGSGQTLDSQGYELAPLSMPLHLPTTNPKSPLVTGEKRGKWSTSQWERVQPLFQQLLRPTLWDVADHNPIRERVLLWLYSKVSFNYHLGSQNDSRCWRDVRALQETGYISHRRAQQAKKFLRDNMAKHTELLEIAKMTLDDALKRAVFQDEVVMWQKKVDVVLLYQKNRIDMTLKNIEEGKNT